MGDIAANRLEDADRERMRVRVSETLHEWDVGAVQQYGPGRRYVVRSVDRETLERLAWHAIGCDSRDLRDCELHEIRGMVDELVETRSAVAS